MPYIRTVPLALLIVSAATRVEAAPPPLIEVQLAKEHWQGKVVAQSDKHFWLIGQDGWLHVLPVADVVKYRQVSPQFNSWTGAVLRTKLRNEFGRPFEIVTTRHYAVCAAGDQKARAYADTFEELFRSFQMYFSIRGFKINEPEFPLVAVIFPDYDSFARYGAKDGVQVSKNLKGYYLKTSNRIALYEEPEPSTARLPQEDPRDRNPDDEEFPPPMANADKLGPVDMSFPVDIEGSVWGAIEANLHDTMLHEATHQAAFNTGLHTRLGENPKWVVEGLATVFEAPGVRNSGGSAGVATRINRERFIWFGDYAKSRRKAKSLETFISNDDLFASSILDAYSEAWALSFYLIETRPRNYAEYLRTIAARDPLQAYPAEERVADFKKTISPELPLLEAEFLRFMAKIR
jgi:hypothetical protein